MMTQLQYWAMVERLRYLTDKEEESGVSKQEHAELLTLNDHIEDAWDHHPSLANAVTRKRKLRL